MRFELAVALNMLYHSRALDEGRGRLFTNTVSKVIRKQLCPFLSGTRTLTYLERMTLYYMIRGEHGLPFKLNEPKDSVCPSTAVDFENRLMLFYVPTKDLPLRAWQKHLQLLTGMVQEIFTFGNGDTLTYTSVARNFSNISYLKVIGFKVYTEYKQVCDLPAIEPSELDPRLFPYQVEGVRMFEAGFRLMADEQGLGKALTLDTRIPTPTGWTTMGALQVGDRVFDDRGLPTVVTHTYYHKDKNVYRVTFSDGATVDCCEDHLWQIHDQHGVKVVPLKWFLQKDQFGTVRKDKLKDSYIWKYYIPKCAPVQYDTQPVPFDAYVMGALLGDGCLSRPSIMFTTADAEMLDIINARLADGYHLRKRTAAVYDYCLTSGKCGHNLYTKGIRELGLKGTKSDSKFIPDCYKYNTVDIRRDVLRGLLDTDGYATKDGIVEFCSVSKQLAEDVQFLAESLGCLCHFSSKIPKCNGKVCTTAYIVRIKCDCPADLFLLSRKRALLPTERHFKPRRNIVAIEYVGVQDVKCITVDSPMHLYLCDHFVVTHNTAQTLQFLQRQNSKRVLICCPATLKYNWKKEIGMWTKYKASDVSILSGATPYPVSTRFSIINYDILPYWAETLSAARYSFVVSDECHYIQNDSAQRTQAFLEIAKKADDVIFISGTPFTSRPYQMYTALHTIAPKIFKTQKDYGNRFCNPTIERGKTVYKGASNMDVLHSILMDGICIRRLKEDVLAELPSKRRLTIAVASENAELRADAETFRKIRALEQKIAHSSDLLGTLEWQKQIAYLRKRKAVNTWIEDFLQSGKKLVVFGTHDMTLDDVMAKFGDIAVRIDGSTSQKKRNEAIDRFQHDPSVRLFVGNIRAAGVGITLTAASDALIIELPWTYSECAQAEDRVHRIGAKDSVTVWYTICPDSIDERLMDIVNQKAATHTHIFDGTEDNMMLQLKKEGGFLYHSVFGEEES